MYSHHSLPVYILSSLLYLCLFETIMAQEVINTTANMTLYRQNNIDWHVALHICESHGQDLVSVWDMYLQDHIEDWLEELGESVNGEQFWTSGHQSNSTQWQYLDGTLHTGIIITSFVQLLITTTFYSHIFL